MITGVREGCEEMEGAREEKEPDRLMERYGGKKEKMAAGVCCCVSTCACGCVSVSLSAV